MGKKIRRQDEGERATDEPQKGSQEASVIASGTEDEKGDERSDLDGQVSEKKAASPGPSAA